MGTYPPPITEADTTIISRIEELAQKKGWTMSEIALAWIIKRITSPVVGFSSVSRIDEALSVRGKFLDPDEESYLEEPYVPREVCGHT